MASATLNDAISKAHDVTANAVADIQPHVEQVKSDLSGYKDEIVSAVGSAYGASKRAASRAADGMGDLYDSAREYTNAGARSAGRTVRTYPTATVAIAAGIGLLVGCLLYWRRR